MLDVRSIVVPTDFSPLSQAALARAVTLARLGGASIHLVHALRAPIVAAAYPASIPLPIWEELRREAREKLEEARKALDGEGIATVTAEVLDSDDPAQTIGAAAESHDADLVVMGTHGQGGLRHAFLGSVAERTLRTVHRPVLAVKEDVATARQPIRRILVAVDFSLHAEHAAEVGAALALRLGASVDVLHALDLPPDFVPYASDFAMELAQRVQAITSERLEALRARIAQRRVSVTLHSRRGRPWEVIAEAAKELGSQLVVMGTRGRSGLAHALLGSVTERTLRAAPCSVLAVTAGSSRR